MTPYCPHCGRRLTIADTSTGHYHDQGKGACGGGTKMIPTVPMPPMDGWWERNWLRVAIVVLAVAMGCVILWGE